MTGYGKRTHLNSMIPKSVLLAMIIFVMLILMNPVALATSIQKFGIDSRTYASGDLISISGEILDGNSSGQVKIVIWQGDQFPEPANETANTTIYAVDGLFSTTIPVPSNSGPYTIAAVDTGSGIISPWLNFNVLGINDPKTIKIVLTENDVLTVPLNSSDITGPLASGKTGGNISFNGSTYYFLVSDDNIAYLDDDSDMNLTSDTSGNAVVGNLVEGSKIKLNTSTYTIIYIHNETQIVLARPVVPSFSGSGNESVNVTLLAINATNIPLDSIVISLNFIKSDGTSNTTNVTTNINGIATTNISIPTEAGVNHLIAGNVGHLSFVVDPVEMFGDLLSQENKAKHTFSRSETFIAVAYLKNRSSGEPISTATVTASISGPSMSYNLTLAYDSSIGAYTANYTIPANAPLDTYNVKYTAVIGSQTQHAYTNYNLKAYDLFLKAVSKENDESDGFAPGKEAFLLLAGTDLGNGSRLDINNMTGGLDRQQFKLNITNDRGKSEDTNWAVMNLTTFYLYKSVPVDVQDEIKRKMGDNVTIINFTAPASNGIYDIVVQVNLTRWTIVKTSISVQDLFVRGEPVNKNGWFNPRIAPGAYARLLIMAFDPSTGEQLSADRINDAGLVEVFSESADDVVTQYMLNSTLETIEIPYMGQVKALKFQVNDSYLGFHFVKFWINATVNGTSKTVIGNGWFDEKSYTIMARPVYNTGTGMFKTFGGNNDINLSVYVEDMSGNNVSGASIEVQNVRYGMTGENVPLNSSQTSFTTDSNGMVTVTIDPTGTLKSGFYNVRIKMTTQEGVTDYGNGWFEVRNFIFFAYSTSWDAAVNKPIQFSLNAFNSNFQNKSANVTLTRINSMGDWEMMTPPSVFNDTEVLIGPINGTYTYEYPGLPKGGDYEFVFEANDGSSTEVGYAWVHVTPFIAWIDTYGKYEFSTSGFLNFTVVASGDKFGGAISHNITNITVEKVMQEGMQMAIYRNKSQMAAITTTQQTAVNRMNVSVNTTGWGQGGYSMILKVTDNQSNEIYTQFWFQLKLASVTVPELMRVTINGGQFHTNTTAINATSDIIANKDKFTSIGSITAGKASSRNFSGNPDEREFTMIAGNGNDQVVEIWNHSLVPYFAMAAIDTVNNTVYMEFENQSEPRVQYYNLSDNTTTQVFNASVGDSFTDYTGRTWEILEITSDGTIKLQGINTLKNGLMINSTVMAESKSGKFLMGTIYDEEWRNVDLNGDGQYYGNQRYNILMLDSVDAGIYDKVYISNISNFSSGTYIDASSGSGVQFGGDPIYLLSNKYTSGAYMLDFTTYRKGWGGMNLGTFANGSVIKIPVLVLEPDGTPVSGSNVSIDFLMDESRLHYPLTGINSTTDSKGLTIISINSTANTMPTGAWMIYYNASIDGSYATADEDMFWEMPRFELRNFMVTGALGIPGRINLTRLSDNITSDGLPGNNMLLNFGDEIEFRRGIGTWWNDGAKYQLEYPFERWYFNNTTQGFNYSTDWGITMYPGNGTLINSSSAKNVITYNVTKINNSNDQITLQNGLTNYSMWRFNVTINGPNNATIAMSYKGWPWTMPGGSPGGPGPIRQTFNTGMQWWIGGLDFTVETIDPDSDTVVLRLNRPVLVANVTSAEKLMDNNTENGELEKMRGSVNKVTFNSMDYLVYGYEDKAPTSADGMQFGRDTMDSVLVENLTNPGSNFYRIGEPIPELNNYYAASAPEWGGKLVLLDNSTTQVFPIPQWGADAPIYYTGNFSDEDIGADLATMGGGGGNRLAGNITPDKRYSILMFDTTPNGFNFPTQAIYDDDPDLTQLEDWSGQSSTSYDMYGPERGYSDAFPMGMFDPMNPIYVNMSERGAWDIGTGNMESYPMAIPTIKINGTLRAMTFIQKQDFDKNDSITLYVAAKDFTGTPINGTAVLTKIKMSFGGSFNRGPFDDLPKTWDMANVSVNLTEGEGLIRVNNSEMPADLKAGGNYDFSFGEFTAFIDVTDNDNAGRTETLKKNFFIMDKNMNKGGPGGGPGGDGGGGGE